MKTNCSIQALSTALPKGLMTNEDLEKLVNTNDEWIRTRTGIAQRSVLTPEENNSDIAIKASIQALEKADIKAEELTHIIVCTCTPEQMSPSMACIIAGAIQTSKTKPVAAFDISAACSGFIYGLEIVRAFFALHQDSKILLVTAEALSRRLNYKDRSTCVLFGDGAAAMIVTTEPKESTYPTFEIIDTICYSDGALKDLIVIGGGTAVIGQVGDTLNEDFFLQMQGREVYKHAIRSMTASCTEILLKHKLTLDDIRFVVPHQANIRIIEAVYDRLGVTPEKRFTNVEHFGNTSASSIPLALDEIVEKCILKQGDTILMTTVGGGMTWGSALIKVL